MVNTSDTKTEKLERFNAATYKVQQAAELAQVSVRTIWRLIDARKVPGVIRMGKVVRISKMIFDKWLEGGHK